LISFSHHIVCAFSRTRAQSAAADGTHFTSKLLDASIEVSMDGRGRATGCLKKKNIMDSLLIQRKWWLALFSLSL
jgi:hypothetical protein